MDTRIPTATSTTSTTTSTARVAIWCAAVLLLVAVITVAVAAIDMPSPGDLPRILLSFGIPVVGATWAMFLVGDYLRTLGLSEIPFEVVAALMVGIVAVAVMLLRRSLELSRRGRT